MGTVKRCENVSHPDYKEDRCPECFPQNVHKTSIDYEGGINKLAEDLGNLRYDVFADFLYALSCKLTKDAYKDKMAGRDRIANELNYSAAAINNAWRIAKPYMDAKKDDWIVDSYGKLQPKPESM